MESIVGLLFLILLIGLILSPIIIILCFMLTVTKRLREISSECRTIRMILEKSPATRTYLQSKYGNSDFNKN